MKFSLEWLSDFVDPAAAGGPAGVRALLDRAGFPVESVEGEGAAMIFDVEITPNRPDAMSHRGLAREIAAMDRRSARSAGSTPDGVIPLRRSAPAARGSSPMGDSSRRDPGEGEVPVEQLTSVTIEVPRLCRRFGARVVRGISGGAPAPEKVRSRLAAIGG